MRGYAVLATFRERLPTRRELLLVFAACAFPVYTWTIVAFLQKLPSWLLFLGTWQLLGALAYTQLSAFVESVLLLLAAVGLALLLPRRLFSDKFVAQGGMVALVTGAWAIALQLNEKTVVRSFTLTTILAWIALLLVPMALLYLLIHLSTRVQRVVESVVDCPVVLLYAYLPLTVVGIIIVAVRNVLGSV